MKFKQWLIAGMIAGAGALLSAQITNVLNPASDLAGKTLVTAEGNRTISGTFTFSVPTRFSPGTSGAPGITLSTDTTTGFQLGAGSIGMDIAGVQDAVLDATGLTLFGNALVNNTGKIPAISTTYFTSIDGAFPTGGMLYFNGSCPTGFTEFTAAQGRYVISVPSGGTLNSPIGTALTNLENRTGSASLSASTSVTLNDPGHSHNYLLTGWSGGITMTGGPEAGSFNMASTATSAAFTGITVSSATTTINGLSGVTGTVAPYIGLRLCQKT